MIGLANGAIVYLAEILVPKTIPFPISPVAAAAGVRMLSLPISREVHDPSIFSPGGL
jgi:hypothetical protein